MKVRSTAAARAMPDTLISAPSAAARSSAARTRWRRRAESVWRPFIMAPVPGLPGAGRAGSFMRRSPFAARGAPDGRHPQVGRPVTADDADRLVDLGPPAGVHAVDVALDLADEVPDPADFLCCGHRVGTGPLIDPVDAGGQPLAGAQ